MEGKSGGRKGIGGCEVSLKVKIGIGSNRSRTYIDYRCMHVPVCISHRNFSFTGRVCVMYVWVAKNKDRTDILIFKNIIRGSIRLPGSPGSE